MSTIADIFGRSPVMPIENHMGIAVECVGLLPDFLRATFEGNWNEAAEVRGNIDRLEHEADAAKRDIRLHLPKSLFMPVPREDLLGLLSAQDEMANRAQRVAATVSVRKMQVPSEVALDLLAFAEANVAAAELAARSVRELDELYTTGFRGAEVTLVESMISELDSHEQDSDAMLQDLQAKVFAIESTLDPVGTVFLYQVITQVAEIGYMAEQVGRRLELLLSR